MPATRMAMCDLSPRNSGCERGARGGKCRACAGGTGAPWLPDGPRVDAGRSNPLQTTAVGSYSNVRGKYTMNPSWYVQRSFADDRG